MSTGLVFAGGAGIDLMRAYQARQILSNVATLACQYASRPSVIRLSVTGATGQVDYPTAVTNYIASTLAAQKLGVMQTNTAPFTYVLKGPADVTLAAAVPTSLTKVLRIDRIPVAATAHCYDSPAKIDQGDPQTSKPFVFPPQSFEPNPSGSSVSFYPIPGRATGTPSSDATKTPAYAGEGGTSWYVTGYCLETDAAGIINGTVPDGQRAIELDCDNGSGNAGNSAISTMTYYEAGDYELRYWYRSRIGYTNYAPAYLCGSTAGDLSWAEDTATFATWGGARTNQVNVYFDQDQNGSAPLHWTIDRSQQLSGSNLIDMCVYAGDWVERSVRIHVTTPGNYWLSYAADGNNDSYGGQIDNIRFCIKTCPNTINDNFPRAWTPSGGPGTEKVLFADTFEQPAYTQDPAISFNRTKGGNLAYSLGTSGPPSGWPQQPFSGWATGPFNEVNVWLQDAAEGRKYVSLQGWNGFSAGTAPDTLNRLISRKFLLVPGYYGVSYAYTSMVAFGADAGLNRTICSSAPRSGTIFPNDPKAYSGRPRYATADVPVTVSTNILGVFMSHGQRVSTLNPNTAMGVASNGSPASTTGGQASYTNPNGSVSTVPTAPPDRVNWASYDANVDNPVIDACLYGVDSKWVSRTATVRIVKTGWYWLTFSAQGDDVVGTGNGPAIDDVKLTALASPYSAHPPSGAVTIPAPDPTPDTAYYPNGTSDFYIVADPFIPPAALP